MHVRNKSSNLLFKAMKSILQCIKRLWVAFFVPIVGVIVIRACVRSVRVSLLSLEISRRRLFMVGSYIVFSYESLDVFLGVANATGELRGLEDRR